MASTFGVELCEQFIAHEFLSLAGDPEHLVRKEAIANFDHISKIVSKQFFMNKLFPYYCRFRLL